MSKRPHGEYIYLDWDTHDPEFHAVKGHVTADEFDQARTAWDGKPHASFDIERVYARWEFAGQDNWGNPSRNLALYLQPGPGRWPVTVMWPRIERRLMHLDTRPAKQAPVNA